MVVVGEAGNGLEAIALVRQQAPDVLVLDLSLPGLSGLDLMRSLRARAPELAVLVFSGYAAEHYAVNLIRKGAQGYLSKESDPAQIVTAVRTLAVGRLFITPEVAELLAQQTGVRAGAPAHAALSEREFHIIVRLARGESIRAIAAALSISAKTVSTYRGRALQKMGLASNSELTYYALKNGLID